MRKVNQEHAEAASRESVDGNFGKRMGWERGSSLRDTERLGAREPPVLPFPLYPDQSDAEEESDMDMDMDFHADPKPRSVRRLYGRTSYRPEVFERMTLSICICIPRLTSVN